MFNIVLKIIIFYLDNMSFYPELKNNLSIKDYNYVITIAEGHAYLLN